MVATRRVPGSGTGYPGYGYNRSAMGGMGQVDEGDQDAE